MLLNNKIANDRNENLLHLFLSQTDLVWCENSNSESEIIFISDKISKRIFNYTEWQSKIFKADLFHFEYIKNECLKKLNNNAIQFRLLSDKDEIFWVECKLCATENLAGIRTLSGSFVDIDILKYNENQRNLMLNEYHELNKTLLDNQDLLQKSLIEAKEAQLKLQETQTRLRSIINNTRDIIISADKNQVITIANQVVQKNLSKIKGTDTLEGLTLGYIFKDLVAWDDYKIHFERALNGEDAIVERIWHMPDEKPFYTEESFYPIKNEENEIEGVAIFSKNITDRRLNEETLIESELRLKLISEVTNDALWDWDVQTDMVYWIKGYSELIEDIPDTNSCTTAQWLGMIHPDDRERVSNRHYAFENNPNQEIWTDEFRIITKKNKVKYIRDAGYAIRNENKAVVRMLGGSRDVTAFINATKELENNKELLDLMGESAQIGAWEIELKSNKPRFTKGFYTIIESESSNVLIIKSLLNTLPVNPFVWKKKILLKLKKGKEFRSELEIETLKGKKKWIFLIAKPYINDSKIKGFFGTIQDITDRKESERLYLENIQNFSSIIDSYQYSIWAVNTEYKLSVASQHFLKSFEKEYNIKLKLNENILESIPNESLVKEWKSYYDRCLKGENFIHRLNFNDSILELVFNSIYDLNGEITGVSIFSHDITQIQNQEAKIIENEKFLNSVIENSPVGLQFFDSKGKILRYNASQKKMFGFIENKINQDLSNNSKIDISQISSFQSLLNRAYKGEIILNEELNINFQDTECLNFERNDEAWFSISLFPLLENKKIFSVVSLILETTKDKRYQQLINKQSNDLFQTEKQLTEYKLMALRAAMNPHFLFNCLNSIQYYISKNEREQALNYLSLFSKLIRQVLNSSISHFNLLTEEIILLKIYIELESMRFDNKFTTKLIINDNVETEIIKIPSMIFQPYIENAILHGLTPLESSILGQLTIKIEKFNSNVLYCMIEDNGIGRKKSKALKTENNRHQSLGMKVTEERLKLINKENTFNIVINDLEDENGLPLGTRVNLFINI